MEASTVYILRLLAACIFLWMAAVPDLRTQKIPLWIPGIFFAAAVGVDLFCAPYPAEWGRWSGALPGVALFFLSLILRGKLGEGDGICLAVCGLLTGIVPAVMIAQVAVILAGLAGGIGIWTGKRKAGDRIAFIPFLAAAGSILLIAAVMKLPCSRPA